MSDKVLFTDGQDVDVDQDLQYMEDQRVGEQDTRFKEISGSFGILIGLALNNPSPYAFQVGAGVAYNDLGKTIRVIAGDSYAPRAEPLSGTFAAGDVGKLFCLAYNETPDSATAPASHPVTGATLQTRLLYYPTVALRNAALAHEVVIGSIGSIDGSGNCTFDLSTAQYWGARLTPQQIADIAEALFEVRTHQQRDHVPGIETVGGGGDPGALTVDGTPTPDRLIVTDTVAGDSLLIDDTRLQGASKFSDRVITFTDGAVTADPQLWAIVVDKTGACSKVLAAQYTATQNVTGTQLVDVVPFGIPYPVNLTIDHYISSGNHFLRINGNPASAVQITGDGLYVLRTDSDPDHAVLVYADLSALPGTGTTGSPVQDAVTMFPAIYDDPALSVSGALLLGFVFWYGTGLNLLGYGTWATTGQAYDKRNHGNLDDSRIADSFETRLRRILSETRAYGFVAPVSLTTPGGLNVTLVADADQPYAYVDGVRLRVPRSTTFGLPDNATSVVYLQNAGGGGLAGWNHQLGTGSIGVALSTGKLPAFNVTTSGGAVTTVESLVNALPNIDAEAARLGRPNKGTLDVENYVARQQTVLGRDLIGNGADAAKAKLQPVLAPTANAVRSSVLETLIDISGLEFPLGWVDYANNVNDQTPRYEKVLNAYWDPVAVRWKRRITGTDSAILRLQPDGTLKFFKRRSASSDTWTDTYNANGWEELRLHSDNAVKAKAQGTSSSGGGFASVLSLGCTLTRDATADTFTATFDAPGLASDDYIIHITAWLDSGSTGRRALHPVVTAHDRNSCTFFFEHWTGTDFEVWDLDVLAAVGYVNVTVI